MKKQFISTRIELQPYGLLRISAQVERDTDFDPHTEGLLGSPWCISSLHAIDADGDDYADELEPIELEQVENALIEKYLLNEQSHRDTLIDEAIKRGRSLAHRAYA